jgi:hypothetical protein
MSVLLRVAELNAAYAATIHIDRLESWPDFFVEDCLYKMALVQIALARASTPCCAV